MNQSTSHTLTGVLTPQDSNPISEAYNRYHERNKDKDNPAVRWRFFQASADYQEEGEPQQWFIVCDHDELRQVKKSNVLTAGIMASKLIRRRQRGAGVDGWYVQSLSRDGSKTWFLLGGDVSEVVAFYDSL